MKIGLWKYLKLCRTEGLNQKELFIEGVDGKDCQSCHLEGYKVFNNFTLTL